MAEILLVEDNPSDQMLVREAYRKSTKIKRLHVAVDGVEAMAFLNQMPPFADAPTPAFILLDLNMPRKSGHEVLSEIKADARLRKIPVIILTTSNAVRDVEESYARGANCYLTKPSNVKDFFALMKSVEDYWLSLAVLPHQPVDSPFVFAKDS